MTDGKQAAEEPQDVFDFPQLDERRTAGGIERDREAVARHKLGGHRPGQHRERLRDLPLRQKRRRRRAVTTPEHQVGHRNGRMLTGRERDIGGLRPIRPVLAARQRPPTRKVQDAPGSSTKPAGGAN